MRPSTSLPLVLAAALAVGGGLWFAGDSLAGDAADAPGSQADPAADIGSFYAWHTATSLVTVTTFAPLAAAGGAATYDADVLYEVHVDYDADNTADGNIQVRFGQNAASEWGVQGIFSSDAGSVTIEGAVETALVDAPSTIQLWAGPADDPFFMDLQGYQDTVATGTVAFDSTRDGFAGTNVTAIVTESPLPIDAGGSPVTTFSLWATTGRL